MLDSSWKDGPLPFHLGDRSKATSVEAESEKVAKELQGLLVARPAADAPAVVEDTDAAKALLA